MNLTNASASYDYFYLSLDNLFVKIIFLSQFIIAIIAVIGNLLILTVLIKSAKLRNSGNNFSLGILALCDFILGIGSIIYIIFETFIEYFGIKMIKHHCVIALTFCLHFGIASGRSI